MSIDYMNMSDEEFLKQAPPTDTRVEEEELEETVEQEEVYEPEQEESHDTEEVEEETYQPDKQEDVFTGSKEDSDEEEEESTQSEKETSTEIDYKAEYEKLVAPIKANGKQFEIRSAEEAKQLQQMGADYTRKMQQIAPHRKNLLMLENAGITDQESLSYLIDLYQKKPDAIAKLVRDAGIDPLDIDTDEEATYVAGNHSVTDEEVVLRQTVENLRSNPSGTETLTVIHNSWDQASKEKLWAEPQIMEAIHEHRETGIYDQINNEIERLTLLGQIPQGTPFLQAYKAVGEMLSEQGTLQQEATQERQPVAVRTGGQKRTEPKRNVRAASTSPVATSNKGTKVINPLAMSDEEFMKQHEQFMNRM